MYMHMHVPPAVLEEGGEEGVVHGRILGRQLRAKLTHTQDQQRKHTGLWRPHLEGGGGSNVSTVCAQWWWWKAHPDDSL